MAKEKFLLVSLSESKTKELAQAITNETCRKILDYLADKESTESELAEKLAVPISTVHYNLQQLQKGGLVTVEEFHYSEKGREVNHYKLANKYIIIAPKSTFGIKEKLRSIIPAALLIGAGAAIIQIFPKLFSTLGASKAAEKVVAEKALMAAAPAADTAAETVTQASPSLMQNIALWFLIGASAALIIYLFVEWLRNRKE